MEPMTAVSLHCVTCEYNERWDMLRVENSLSLERILRAFRDKSKQGNPCQLSIDIRSRNSSGVFQWRSC